MKQKDKLYSSLKQIRRIRQKKFIQILEIRKIEANLSKLRNDKKIMEEALQTLAKICVIQRKLKPNPKLHTKFGKEINVPILGDINAFNNLQNTQFGQAYDKNNNNVIDLTKDEQEDALKEDLQCKQFGQTYNDVIDLTQNTEQTPVIGNTKPGMVSTKLNFNKKN